jgi:hypothetical protein
MGNNSSQDSDEYSMKTLYRILKEVTMVMKTALYLIRTGSNTK